jgi:hypothetical protein
MIDASEKRKSLLVSRPKRKQTVIMITKEQELRVQIFLVL